MKPILLLGLWVLSVFYLPAFSASFDCTKATTYAEKQICTNPTLSKLDEDLAELYPLALAEVDDQEGFQREQRKWLKNMRGSCSSADCLIQVYRERINELDNLADLDCAKIQTLLPAQQIMCSHMPSKYRHEELRRTYAAALSNLSYTEGKALRKSQHTWARTVRDSCQDLACIEKIYPERLAVIKAQGKVNLPPVQRPNFTISDGENLELCQEYLKVLNRTPIETLKPCEVPDLAGSPIRPVLFKPLTGEALKAMDKIIYGAWTHNKDWHEQWPTRQEEYAMGYRRLGESYWDLDKDGSADQIIEAQEPGKRCMPYGNGDVDTESVLAKNKWLTMSKNEKLASAQINGFFKGFYLIRGEQFSYVTAENYIEFQDEKFSVDQVSLRSILTSTKWGSKDWVQIAGVKPKRDNKHDSYDMTSAKCKFWLN